MAPANLGVQQTRRSALPFDAGWHRAGAPLTPVVLRISEVAAIYEIDSDRVSILEGFFGEVSRVLIPEATWGHNLDAFNDILRGGFGTPEDGFTIRWKNHALSRERLGYPETVRQLEIRLQHCHSSNRAHVARQLDQARAGNGPTVFDWLVEIIRDHGPGGQQEQDCVELKLE